MGAQDDQDVVASDEAAHEYRDARAQLGRGGRPAPI